MWRYQKKLQYPINITKKDLKMAKLLTTQYGGSNGELGAALRYLNQRYTMPDNKGQALLTDIGTEELAHIEMISTMVYQLLKDATIEEIKQAGLDPHYAEHKLALYPTNADGVPFTVDYFATTGDPIADLAEDMECSMIFMEWAVNSKMYSVVRIDEDLDFGCEERTVGTPVMAVVTLQEPSGEQTVVRQPDRMLYDRQINVGDQVSFDDQGKLVKG